MLWDRDRLFTTTARGAILSGCLDPAPAWGILSDDLYIPIEPWPRIGRPPECDLSAWTVTDDWQELVPVTQAEVDMFEAWFGDLFDELFGPRR